MQRQDLMFQDAVVRDFDEFVPRLMDRVKSKGGVTAEKVQMHPLDAIDITLNVQSPWWKRYFGTDTFEQAYEKALAIYNGTKDPDAPQPLRDLAALLGRQAQRNDVPYINPLEANLSLIDRYFWLHNLLLETDAKRYNVENSPMEFVKHNRAYLGKWGLTSMYNPEIWIENAYGYAQHRELNLSDEDIDVIAEAIVAMQTAFGIKEMAGSKEPMSIIDTHARAKGNNPIAAYSLPTMRNAKSAEASEEVLELAEEYSSNPEEHGNIGFNGQKRVQQGGNVVDNYLDKLYPQVDWSLNYATKSQIEEALELIQSERPDIAYYSKHKVTESRWVNQVALPSSAEERQALVDNGIYSTAITKKSNGEWNFNYYVQEVNIFMLRVDKDPEVSGYAKFDHWNKNRVVFAGSGPVARSKQSFVYVWYDSVKEYAAANGYQSFVSQWREPVETAKVMTNLHALANGLPDYNGNPFQMSPEVETMYGVITGDDKSAFDNFQSIVFGSTFYTCFFGPLFKESSHHLLRYLSLQTTFPMLVTYKGMLQFAESMPSGDGVTNVQDTYITLLAGMFSLWRRTGIRPLRQLEVFKETNAGPSGQGDDYIGCTNSQTTPEDLSADYADLGLIVSGPKSLMSKNSCEFLRQETDGQYFYFPKRTLSNQKSQYRLLATHAPLAHMTVKVHFLENKGSLTAAEGEIAQINRFANSDKHVDFKMVLDRFIPLSKFGLGVKSVDYMPNYEKERWIEDGRPTDTSGYLVRVDTPMRLLDVASKEAQHKGSSLKRDIGVNYQDEVNESDFEKGFPALRIVQFLEAIRTGNDERIRELNSQIVHKSEI